MAKSAIQAGGAFVRLFLKDELTKAVQQTMRKTGESIQSAGKQLAKAGAIFGAAGGGILAPIIASVKHFADAGDGLDKMAARTGVAASSLAELGFAAEQSGSSLESIEKAMFGLSRSMFQAREGSSAVSAALDEIGLSYRDLQGLAPEQQLERISDAIAEVKDESLRGAVAQQLFGRAGRELLPMFGEGRRGQLSELRQEARDLGLVPTQEEIEKAAMMTDAINRLKRVSQAAFFSIGAALADHVIDAFDRAKTVLVIIAQWIKDNQKLVVTVAAVGAGLLAFGGALSVAGFALMGIGAAIKMAAVAVGVLASPLGLLTAAVVAGGVAFFKFTETGKQAWADLIATVMPLVETFKETFGGVADALKAGEIELAGEILMTGLELVVRQGLDSLKGIFGETITLIANQLLSGDVSGAWATVVDSMLVTWQSFKTAAIEVFAGVVTAVQKMWTDLQNTISNKIIEWSMQDGPMGAAARAVLGVDLRTIDTDNERMARDRAQQGLKIAQDLRREAIERGDQDEIDRLNDVIARRERELATGQFGIEPFDAQAEAQRIVNEMTQQRQDQFSAGWLKAAEEARQAERELVIAQQEAQRTGTEAANERVKQLEARLAELRGQAADAVAAMPKRGERDEQQVGGLVAAARPTGIGSVTGMFRAAAIAAAGRGASPEEKNLAELRQIRKEVREQRLAANRQALAAERLNLALRH